MSWVILIYIYRLSPKSLLCLILICVDSPKSYATLLVLLMRTIHQCEVNLHYLPTRHTMQVPAPLNLPHIKSYHISEKTTAPNPTLQQSPPSLPPLHTSLPRCRLRGNPRWSGHAREGPRSNVPATKFTVIIIIGSWFSIFLIYVQLSSSSLE